MWHNIIDEKNEKDTENIIELDIEIILITFVECRFFITLVFSNVIFEVTVTISNSNNKSTSDTLSTPSID